MIYGLLLMVKRYLAFQDAIQAEHTATPIFKGSYESVSIGLGWFGFEELGDLESQF